MYNKSFMDRVGNAAMHVLDHSFDMNRRSGDPTFVNPNFDHYRQINMGWHWAVILAVDPIQNNIVTSKEFVKSDTKRIQTKVTGSKPYPVSTLVKLKLDNPTLVSSIGGDTSPNGKSYIALSLDNDEYCLFDVNILGQGVRPSHDGTAEDVYWRNELIANALTITSAAGSGNYPADQFTTIVNNYKRFCENAYLFSLKYSEKVFSYNLFKLYNSFIPLSRK